MTSLYLTNRDELYRLDPSAILYIQADGNYSNIFLQTKEKLVICKALGKLIEAIDNRLGESASMFCRIGKSLVINLRHVQQLNTPNSKIVLGDGKTFSLSLSASKDAIKALRHCVVNGVRDAGSRVED